MPKSIIGLLVSIAVLAILLTGCSDEPDPTPSNGTDSSTTTSSEQGVNREPTAEAPTPAPMVMPEPTSTLEPTPSPTPAPIPTPTPPPRLPMPDSKPLGEVDLETLFNDIISKTERREAFSEVKGANIGFSAIDDMKALREEFLAAETELDLWFALFKLSNARRDAHLVASTVEGGLPGPERRSCDSAPIYVLPEIIDVHNPVFFVSAVGEGVTSPQLGDVIVGVNGRSIEQYIDESALLTLHSSLPGLYWRMARELPRRIPWFPLSFYSEKLHLILERPSGERYDVALPYGDGCGGFSRSWRSPDPYSGFVEVMERETFNLLVDESREIVLLQWWDFELDELIEDIPALMEYAEAGDLLDYDMIIDVTWSGGGRGGAYAIQRLVDRPFRTTFGNVRLSDLGKARIERMAGWTPLTDAPDIVGLNLSNSWLIEWARTDGKEAIDRGDEYTPPVPFKLAHLPKDSDGILQPAPVHFSGRIAIINARTWGGSHLDQFMAMFVDNGLVTFVGVPTGGFSNTWEDEEVLYFPGTTRPVVEFAWTIGHTLRPNGDILEGNPAQPHIYIPITRENYQDYQKILLDTAIDTLNP